MSAEASDSVHSSSSDPLSESKLSLHDSSQLELEAESELESKLGAERFGEFSVNLSGDRLRFFPLIAFDFFSLALDTSNRRISLIFFPSLGGPFSDSKSNCPLNFFLFVRRLSQISLIKDKSQSAFRPMIKKLYLNDSEFSSEAPEPK